MHRQRNLWRVLLSAVLAVLLLSPAAFAQGNPPVEGMNYRIVHPRDGGNPEWTYFEILPHKNVNTHALAKVFRTDQWSIREDNPTGTLAVCETSPGHYAMSRGIRDPEGRRTNAVWENCPRDKQYVYMLYSTVLVLKGQKHMGFEEKQKVLASLQECKDRTCLLENGSKLSGKDALERPGPGIGAVSPAPAPPAPPPAATSQTSVPPLVAPPTATETPSASWQSDGPFWGALALAVLAIILAVGQFTGRRRSEKLLQEEREVPKMANEYEALSSKVTLTCSRLIELLLGETLSRSKKRQDALLLLNDTLDTIQSRSQEYQASVYQLAKALNGGETLKFEGNMDPSFVQKLTDRLQNALSARILKSESDRLVQEAKDRAATEMAAGSKAEDAFLQQFIDEVFVAFTGEPPGDQLRELPPVNQLEELKRLMGERSDSFRQLSGELGRMVLWAEPDQPQRPFDRTALYEVRDTMQELLKELEPYAALSNDELTTLAARVRYVAKDSTLARFRKHCEALAEQISSGWPKVSGNGGGAPLMTDREIGELMAKATGLETRIAELEGENAGLRVKLADDSPRTKPMPTLQDRNDAPVITLGEAPLTSAEVDCAVEHLGGVKSGRTMAPPAGLGSAELDTRSPKRRAAFTGVHAFADLVEGHATFRLEHHSELPVIRRFAQLLNRNFQWESQSGDTHVFKPGKLLNEQYWAALAG